MRPAAPFLAGCSEWPSQERLVFGRDRVRSAADSFRGLRNISEARESGSLRSAACRAPLSLLLAGNASVSYRPLAHALAHVLQGQHTALQEQIEANK